MGIIIKIIIVIIIIAYLFHFLIDWVVFVSSLIMGIIAALVAQTHYQKKFAHTHLVYHPSTQLICTMTKITEHSRKIF